ncbi:DNA-directed RNA polymerase subunit alpha [Candidatus Saccharibacteria bacterium]|jgi:DNA-directed RNA polymerase subunit alpha|nr:MAG: DNA-directed RNA polymerase subunit alpha [Candidatus Saccharibacteria bacterium]
MSKTIHTPSLASVTDHGKTSATFVIEPLHTGYGMTLGNSLRRVLLSSVAGAAVTSFKIDGATHEFTTIKGVVEDVIDIMQNLKQIRFRVYSDEPQTLRIEKKGAGAVTAKDIKTNADVEIVNPDQLIATLADKASFGADIVVDTGRGYRTIEESGARRASTDMVAIDAIFSPVLRVRYKVENTRVGQMTDLDKVVMTIETDGSISPQDAFEEAAAILVNQYTALAGQTRVAVSAPLGSSQKSADTEISEDPGTASLSMSIEDLNLSARTTNALINNDIATLKDLVSLTDVELRDLKGFGSKALDEVKQYMAELEL